MWIKSCVIKNDTLRTLNHKDTIRVCRLHIYVGISIVPINNKSVSPDYNQSNAKSGILFECLLQTSSHVITVLLFTCLGS